jgi:hypothetical protein
MDHMDDPSTHTPPNTGNDSFNHNPSPLLNCQIDSYSYKDQKPARHLLAIAAGWQVVGPSAQSI